MLRLALVVVPLIAFAACNTENKAYCTTHAGMDGCPAPDAPSGGHCKTSTDCTDTPDFPACETATGPNMNTCVQCTATDHALCTGTTPVCKSDSCAACSNDSDCGNGSDSLCLPNGSCALLRDVAYVDGAAPDGAPCTMSQPCNRIDMAANLKPVVKVTGTVANRCPLNGKTVTILGQSGAKLIPMGGANDGPALEVRGASHVEVYDLEIDQATSSSGKEGSGVLVADTAEVLMTRVKLTNNSVDGVHVTGGHFTCTLCTIAQNMALGADVPGGLLTIHQSTLRDNQGGGINVSSAGSFQIVGNVFFNNGQNNKATGGINLNPNTGSDLNRLDFNSFSHNTAGTGLGQAIQCFVPLTASNNIVWDNRTPAPLPLVSGTCTFAYSDIASIPAQTGTNMTMPPMFKDETNGDLHLTSQSPVRRMADPAANLKGLAAYDIDGDPRVSPADLGADQTP